MISVTWHARDGWDASDSNTLSCDYLQARLFGPALFESKKLKTFFLGLGQEQHPTEHEEGHRTYTLTHCDFTSKLTLAVAREFNKEQVGWTSIHGSSLMAIRSGLRLVESRCDAKQCFYPVRVVVQEKGME